jgi:AcrR family transcriptional regulator
MATTDTRETRDRLLDEAERLFGERGIPEVSLREITSAADANIASVNYHFGSKDGLVRELFARRMGPLNEERLRLLKDLQAASGEGPPPLEGILRAFAGPTLRTARRAPNFMMLAARYHLETRAQCTEILHSPGFHELVSLMREMLLCAFPNSQESSIWLAVHFFVGMMLHTWIGAHAMEELSGGIARWDDVEEMIDQLVTFGTAGFRAVVEAER